MVARLKVRRVAMFMVFVPAFKAGGVRYSPLPARAEWKGAASASLRAHTHLTSGEAESEMLIYEDLWRWEKKDLGFVYTKVHQ